MEDHERSDEEPEGRKSKTGQTLGAAIAIGVGVGVALFAATDSPAWIAVGVGVGLAIGVASQTRSR